MVKVIQIKRTCEMCPSQWEGMTDDSRKVYIRYRGGWLNMNIGKPFDTERFAAVGGECIYSGSVGEYGNGYLEYSELKKVIEGFQVANLPKESK